MSASTTSTDPRLRGRLATYPWKTATALVLVYVGVWTNLSIIWGGLWLWWGLEGLRARESAFLDVVSRDQYPLLYWALVATWVLLGGYLMAAQFYPWLLAW